MDEIRRLSAGLRQLKESKRLTSQRWSDDSGVPVSTISRILSGHTDSPNFLTVAALVRTAEGSLDELAGISVKSEPLTDVERKELEMLREEKVLLLRYIDVKNRWIRVLFFVSAALAAFVIIALMIDYMDHSRGFFWLLHR